MAGAGHARAGEAEIAAIGAVYGEPSASEERFSARFRQAVPFVRIETAVNGLRDQYGPALVIRQIGGDYEIETSTHRIPVEIALNDDNRIEGLLFRPAQRLTGSIGETLRLLAAVPGSVSYAIIRDGDLVHERDADRTLAVGSAFKLAVLKVLADDIDAGTRGWDDVTRLKDADKSLPSGRLQDYPAGSPFTLHTLAAAMIAESDNTATDMLIRLLGRDRIAGALGIETLLTTREFFTLKADPGLCERYAAADRRGRAGILTGIAGRGLPLVGQVIGPFREGVEWHVSNRTLCALASAVRDIDVFAINPGPVETATWRRIAYKGGSESGVLNLTAAMQGEDGTQVCVSVTVNSDRPVAEAEVAGLFARLTAQLAAPGDGAD